MPITRSFRVILAGASGAVALSSARPAEALLCTVATNPVPFGTYNTASTVDATTVSTLTVSCQSVIAIGVSYTIALTAGTSGTTSTRKMINGTWSMNYQLYSDPTYTTIWGDGTGTSRTVSDNYALAILNVPVPKAYTIYGRIPARQNLAAGSYVDAITILVTY